MTTPAAVNFAALDIDALKETEGAVAVLVGEDGALGQTARRVNKLVKGAVERAASGEGWGKMKAGDAMVLAFPVGLPAEKLVLLKLDNKADALTARKAGVALAKAAGSKAVTLVLGSHRRAGEIALGATLRGYGFADHKSEPGAPAGALTVMVGNLENVEGEAERIAALAAGTFFTRDLVAAPSNVLTTTEFSEKFLELKELGVEVEVLDEPRLEELGMRTLLAVGMGSETPSKVVVLQWKGGEGAPLALVGKGVVFDTGGISLKPAGGMEDMTMDMGGAGTVAGVMKTLALRKAPAHVVGLVGLVENMPDGRAQRPGDIVASMKGDTVEVINTDAEGRLVLCDVMWYAQERFEPAAMVDLATLTGACIIALGHDNAGVFSNDDAFCNDFLKAAKAEGEGAWRLPLGAGYAKQLKSEKADVKNVGGRPAGASTAAEFLHRFVKDGTPWIHLDIAGVAQAKESPYAPNGATGWGVLALDRLVRTRFEG